MAENEILGLVVFSLFLLCSFGFFAFADKFDCQKSKMTYVKYSLAVGNVLIISALFVSTFLEGRSGVLIVLTIFVFIFNLIDLIYFRPKDKNRINNLQSCLCYKCKLSDLFLIERTVDTVQCLRGYEILNLVHKSLDFNDIYYLREKIIFRNINSISNSRIDYILKFVEFNDTIKKNINSILFNGDIKDSSKIIEYFQELEIDYPIDKVDDDDINSFLYDCKSNKLFSMIDKKINKSKKNNLM